MANYYLFRRQVQSNSGFFSGIKKPLLVSYRLANFVQQLAELTLPGTETALALDKFLHQSPRIVRNSCVLLLERDLFLLANS